jgi:3-deoxy-D-arabino-heptulosonate 7-phosphate (DAHP) synthase
MVARSHRSVTAVRLLRSATVVPVGTAVAVRTSPARVVDANADAGVAAAADPVVVGVGPQVRAAVTRGAARDRTTVPWRR